MFALRRTRSPMVKGLLSRVSHSIGAKQPLAQRRCRMQNFGFSGSFRSTSSSTPHNNKEKKGITNGDDQSVFERTVYVHPLSQIILEHLQNEHHGFVVSRGLDSSLTMHRDGSFELRFPPQLVGDTKDENVHRIWTSYDEVDKKHWLSYYRGQQFHGRFLLQDNLLSAWNNNRKSLPERIQTAVDEMVRTMLKHRV